MPIRKLSLNRAELPRYLSVAQQLYAAGCDIEIPAEWQKDSSALDIHLAAPEENIVRQLPTGGVGYAVWARLIAQRSGLILQTFGLAAAWDPDLIPLSPGKEDLYFLKSGFNFARYEVLNHRIEKLLRFHHRGYLAEGWLLATGLKPIPELYPDHMSVRVEVSFTDQFGVDHVSPAYAFMERSAHYKAPTLRKENSAGLYAPNLRSASIGENKVSTPACRTEDTGSAGAPAVRRRREQALVEDFWDHSSS
jgi:hypothetical protein